MLPAGPHRVLDAGAGTGMLSRAYGEHAGQTLDVTAVDLSPRMLECARQNWNRHFGTLRTVVSDVAGMSFPSAHFELVMSAHCIEHTPDPPAAVREMARVLRPNALLLLVTGRPGPLDAVTSRIWQYPRIFACDVMRWMWECNVAPIGRLRFGRFHQPGYWLSEAVLGRRQGQRRWRIPDNPATSIRQQLYTFL